jgi:hypothetical protein
MRVREKISRRMLRLGALLVLVSLPVMAAGGCLYVSTPASQCITDPPRNGVQITSCPDPYLGWALPHVHSVPVPGWTPNAEPTPSVFSSPPPAAAPPPTSSSSGVPE